MVYTKALRAFIRKGVRVRLSPAAPRKALCATWQARGLAQLARARGLGP